MNVFLNLHARQTLLNSSENVESREATVLFQLIRLADKNPGLRSCRIPDTAGNQAKHFLWLIYFQVNMLWLHLIFNL